METTKIKRVLIAVRPWERRLPMASSHARFLAESLGGEIALISCISESQIAFGLAWADPAAVAALRTETLDTAKKDLEELARPLRDAGVGVTTLVATHTPVYQGILDAAANWRADLLVVGVHEWQPVPHTRLTDINWQLMRLSPCPLLLVKNPNIESYGTVLAAVDPLHRHAEPAGLDRAVLRTAADLGRAFGARLSVANVYPDPRDYEFASSVEVVPGVYYGTENIEAAHGAALNGMLDEYGIARTAAILRPGAPAAMLVALASEHKIDLVVLGAVKRSRLEAAILGSTAEAVVADAPCDVLLVKPPA